MEKLPYILLVDDDETTNFLNELLLNKLEVVERVHVAYNGKQAIELLTQLPPEMPTLLLLDVNMPGMTGIEFLEAYQHLPATQRAATTVIVLTTSMASKDLGRLNELSIAGMVSKPLNREKVDVLLQIHFRRQLPTE